MKMIDINSWVLAPLIGFSLWLSNAWVVRAQPVERQGTITTEDTAREVRFLHGANSLCAVFAHEWAVLDRKTGKPSGSANREDASLHSLSISGDGRTVAIGGSTDAGRAQLFLWDTKSNKRVLHMSFPERDFLLAHIEFASDGSLIALERSGDTHLRGNVFLVDVAKKQVTKRLVEESAYSISLSADKTKMVVGHVGGRISVWNFAKAIEEASFVAHRSPIHGVLITPDLKTIVSVSADKEITVWNSSDYTKRYILKGHKDAGISIAMSSDGNRLASTDMGGTMKIWDLTNGQELGSVQAHIGLIWSVCFSDDGQYIATSGNDKKINVWKSK